MRRAALLMLLALAHAKLHFSGRRVHDGLNGAHAMGHNNLVDSLRRQLMHDNYDYMSSVSDDRLAPAPQLYDDVGPTLARSFEAGRLVDDGDYFPEPSPARARRKRPRIHRLRSRTQQRRRRPREQLSVEDEPQVPAHRRPYQRVESNVPVSNKDLYYYMDDARLNGGDPLAFNVLDVADAPDNDDFDDDAPPSATRKKKYTILEIEGGGGTRRSGAGGRRRFVQEEGDDGIAIVSLDNGPFPEFRLPTDRRQYMHHEYEDAPNVPLHAPPPQRHRAPLPRYSLEHSQQEDELLYLS